MNESKCSGCGKTLPQGLGHKIHFCYGSSRVAQRPMIDASKCNSLEELIRKLLKAGKTEEDPEFKELMVGDIMVGRVTKLVQKIMAEAAAKYNEVQVREDSAGVSLKVGGSGLPSSATQGEGGRDLTDSKTSASDPSGWPTE